MSRATPVDVIPSVMEWARTTAGLTRADAARRAALETARLSEIETGRVRPLWVELKRLAHVYQRAPAALLLERVPDEPVLPKYFRTSQPEGSSIGRLSRETLLALRRARQLQAAFSIVQRAESTNRPRLPGAKLTDSPAVVSGAVRDKLGLSQNAPTPSRTKDPREAFQEYRSVLFDFGILALQLQMPPEEVRGFCLIDQPAPALVVSQSDSPTARSFTLFHELGHLLIRDAGICEISFRSTSQPRSPEERFCNSFAGNFLVPSEELLGDTTGLESNSGLDSFGLEKLSRRYAVSREVILRRLVDLGRLSAKGYRDRLTEVVDSYDEVHDEPAGGADYVRLRFSQYGPRLAGLILDAADSGRITYRDAVGYLGLKADHFDRVREFVDRASRR